MNKRVIAAKMKFNMYLLSAALGVIAAAALVLLVLDLIPNFPTSIAEEIIDYAWENSIPSKCLYVLRFTFHDRYFSGGWRFEDNFYMDEAYGQYVTTYEWEQWTG